MNKFDVFISYSTKDKTISDATCAALESAGIRCWIAPRDITPGMEWGEAIVDAIDNCCVFVLIFSSNANDSPQIHRETERAVNRGIPVLPLRIEDIVPTKAMAYFVDSVHWLDAMTPPLEDHLTRLAQSIRALLESNGDTTAALRVPIQADSKNLAEPSGIATPAYFVASSNRPAASSSRREMAIQILCWVVLVTFACLQALFIVGTVVDWDKPDRASIVGDLFVTILFLAPALFALRYIMKSRSRVARNAR
jgi:hypothetical protein